MERRGAPYLDSLVTVQPKEKLLEPQTILHEFADRYRARITTPRSKPIPPDSEDVIGGKCGMIGALFAGESGMSAHPILLLHLLAVPRHANRDRILRLRAKGALDAGMKLKVGGGGCAESVWYFDPTNETQALAALKLVGARRRRRVILTEEQKTALIARLATARTVHQNAIS